MTSRDFSRLSHHSANCCFLEDVENDISLDNMSLEKFPRESFKNMIDCKRSVIAQSMEEESFLMTQYVSQ